MKRMKDIFIDKFILNKTLFKIVYLAAIMLTTVPYLHGKLGSYVKYILIWGLLLAAIDFIKSKGRILADKYMVLLMLFCLSYAVTILLNRGEFFGDSMKSLLYMVMTFLVAFRFDKKDSNDKVKKEAGIISAEIIIGTFILSTISLVTYFFQINVTYVVDGATMYIGQVGGRLWGLYNPNVSATLVIVSLVLTCFSISVIRKRNWTIFAVVNIVIQFMVLILAASRTVTYGAYIGLFFLIIFIVPLWKPRFAGWRVKSILVRITCAIIIIGGIFGLMEGGKRILGKIPDMVNSISQAGEIKESAGPAYHTGTLVLNTSNLEREDLGTESKGGILNGRQYIWKAGYNVFKSSPIFGVTKENIYTQGKDYVEIKTFRRAFNRGGLHNIYLTVLAASGMIGFLILAVFVIIGVIDVVRDYKRINTINGNEWFIAAGFLVALYFIMELFEARILYEVNISFLMFWIFAGYVVKLSSGSRECTEYET